MITLKPAGEVAHGTVANRKREVRFIGRGVVDKEDTAVEGRGCIWPVPGHVRSASFLSSPGEFQAERHYVEETELGDGYWAKSR